MSGEELRIKLEDAIGVKIRMEEESKK